MAGATVHSIGVAPTPAVAYLTGSLDFDAGVVISASHNPYQDNGIKVFSGAGVKYGEHFEEAHRTARRRCLVGRPRGGGDRGSQSGASSKVSGSCAHGAAKPGVARACAPGGRLRQRRDDRRCAGALQGARVRCDSDRVPNRTAATSTKASAPRIRRSSRRSCDAIDIASAWRSTATAIAPSSSTATVACWTAITCC